MKQGDSRVWHPNTQMSEWDGAGFDSISRGRGVWLVDSKGRKMIDGVASMWCNVWGHSNAELVRAMTQQAQKMQHTPLFNLTHRPAERLALSLVKMSPGMSRVMYSDNGSTAMEIAIKMAVQYWSNRGEKNRTAVASLERGYHGDTIGAMSAGQIPEFFDPYKSQMSKAHELPVALQRPTARRAGRAGGGDGTDNDDVQDALESISRTLSSRGDIAAVVMESGAQVAGGVRIYGRGFQRGISRICRRNDVLLIVDEVATGFGRLGPMCVYSDEGSRPDMVAYGKMLTGGCLPLAATLATERVYRAFLGGHDKQRHLFHGHTFAGNPVAAAVASKNLSMYSRYGLIRRISRTSRVFEEYRDKILGMDIVGDVRHKGMIMGIELVSGKGSGAPSPVCPPESVNRIMYEAGRRRGVYLRTLGNVVMIVPPLAISSQDLATLIERTIKAIRDAEPSLLQRRKPNSHSL